MVLEELRNVKDEKESDNLTSSTSRSAEDSDPWPSSAFETRAQKRVAIDKSNLPRPVPVFGPLFGFTQISLDNSISTAINTMSRIVQRPLTYDECQAVAYHTAKGRSISSYGSPIGMAAGIWRSVTTKNSYRFPLFKPDMKSFDPYKLGPLRGPSAETGWHSLRLVTYAGVGGLIGRIIVGGYAATVAATGYRMDVRLKDVVEVIQAKVKSERGQPSGNSNSSTAAPRQQPQDLTFTTGGRARTDDQLQQNLDASPTAHGWNEGNSSTKVDYGNAARPFPHREQQRHLWQDQDKIQDQRQEQQRQQQNSQTTSTGGLFDFGNYDETSSDKSTSPVQDSAWDRIRRNNIAGGNSSQNSSKSSRRWTPDQGWEDQQQQSHNETQREFDARVDHEIRD